MLFLSQTEKFPLCTAAKACYSKNHPKFAYQLRGTDITVKITTVFFSKQAREEQITENLLLNFLSSE